MQIVYITWMNWTYYRKNSTENIDSYSEKLVEESKEKKDRVSIRFCANSTSTHKLHLLFMHKYA